MMKIIITAIMILAYKNLCLFLLFSFTSEYSFFFFLDDSLGSFLVSYPSEGKFLGEPGWCKYS